MLDSDDTIQRDYLKLMYEATKFDEVEVVICDINNVNEENIFEEIARTNKIEIKIGREFFQDFIMHNVSIGPVSLMIKREFIQKLNLYFNEMSRYSEEFIFITDLLYNANRVVHIQEKLYNYCLRRGSVSTGANLEKIINGYQQIVIYSERYKDDSNTYAIIYNKYALARWILATARFTANNLQYIDYKKLMNELNAKKQIKVLFKFPKLSIKMASIVFCISMPIFYRISKKN